MEIDTKIILIPCIITEILMKTRFSVMAALICILRGLPKYARVASFRFLKSTPHWYRKSTAKILCMDCSARLLVPATGVMRSIFKIDHFASNMDDYS